VVQPARLELAEELILANPSAMAERIFEIVCLPEHPRVVIEATAGEWLGHLQRLKQRREELGISQAQAALRRASAESGSPGLYRFDLAGLTC
jgi:hypothetical protein